MPENKTPETNASVEDFINAVPDEVKRADAWKLVEIMSDITGQPPRLWGPSIVGFGFHHYTYATGHEGDMPIAGFSPRKAAITLYLNSGSGWEAHADLLETKGKHKLGKGCLYIKRLSDVQIDRLTELIRRSASEYLKPTPDDAD
ncbi:MAG: DUF1801 domain-containing protein [Thermomicrobiales bacterium]